MAIATLKHRGRNEVQPENALDGNIAARAAALREGRAMPALARHNAGAAAAEEYNSATLTVTLEKRPGVSGQVTCNEGIDVEVRSFRRSDFHSAPDARPMNKADICNVQILTRVDVDALTREYQDAAPGLFKRTRAKIDAEWAGLLDDSERYALTAYAMRKLKREGKV